MSIKDKNIAHQSNSDEKDKKSFWASGKGFLVLTFLVFVFWFATLYFAPILFGAPKEAGTAGDMFGGLTALFSGLAFAGLVTTLFIQQEELKQQRNELSLQREELKQTREVFTVQRFENTFFGLLELLNRQVQSFTSPYFDRAQQKRKEKTGKDVLEKMASKLPIQYRYIYKVEGTGDIIKAYKIRVNDYGQQENPDEERDLSLPELMEEYSQMYNGEFETDLGPYFRLIYNTIKVIERADFSGDNVTELRQNYADLLRAHLSSSEVKLLMFNCLSPMGEKLKPFVEKYGLLKHLKEKDKSNYSVLVSAYDKDAFEK